MGQECLGVCVGHIHAIEFIRSGYIHSRTVEADLGQRINLFADAVVCHQLIGTESRTAEVVVQVAAEVQILAGGKINELTGFLDVVGDRLFHKHVLAGVEGFHSGNKVPRTVFKAGGRHMNDFDLRMREKHFLEGVERRNLEFFRGVVRFLLIEIADRDKLCQCIVLDAGCVLMTNTAHTDDGTLENFFH